VLPPQEPPSAVEWMRQRTGIDITQCPHCGSEPLIRQPLPFSYRPGAESRGPQRGHLGLGMTEPWTRRLRLFSYHAWTSLAPRGQCASAASGAAFVPATCLLWGYLGARHRGGRPR
jgi:hypothetical protein